MGGSWPGGFGIWDRTGQGEIRPLLKHKGRPYNDTAISAPGAQELRESCQPAKLCTGDTKSWELRSVCIFQRLMCLMGENRYSSVPENKPSVIKSKCTEGRARMLHTEERIRKRYVHGGFDRERQESKLECQS